ncbi:radical SAM family uncharacterized protein [Peptoclostridium litorale DSM 5388]|uniref:Radical SAM superfamily protein n=1 Tax=Peptoclostridium litorale DSM 5388 TaxID=1121324 RepID=A0A069RBB4_PEPLI|nr:TIGR03960 family B12-binding radical SAM protein [Peptoclostridium litorale]KDR94068.1 radical SAM superfamily protein [Peptoclostridium litorale DSM 5388]SIN80441.1 radical SAM family uncharacterized protein [Peptoclostridium litorale DSM 5388]
MERVEINDILLKVEKPARYTGNEINVYKKEIDEKTIRFAFAFPDIYEVGMSFMGMQILYNLLNNIDDVYCERVFAPASDMESVMREKNLPLFALESRHPLKNFDFVGFTLQYELSYTNILNMLDLSGIPLYANDRSEEDPFVIVGGPCVYNMEPIADFVDIATIGEGEEVMAELMDSYRAWKKSGKSKRDFLVQIARDIEGVYIPSLYDCKYNEDGTLKEVSPNIEGVPAKIKKRIIKDLDSVYYQDRLIVPYIDIVHDRIMLEIFRGCTRGCRFCQAGMLYRPIRERSVEKLKQHLAKIVKSTGYEEISLSSLSTSDYSGLEELTMHILKEYSEKEKISLSLPSLRLDNFSAELAQKIQEVRKSGLTFAPEAGTQRLRDVINKGITEEDLENAMTKAFGMGWSNVKLYFMMSLPTETYEDLDGIGDLAYKVLDIYRDLNDGKLGRNFNVTVSTSSFVPKPFTPFQWEPQNTVEELREKQRYLVQMLKNKNISYKYHESKTSFLEAVMARGDRRLSKVIHDAFKKGCTFDGWDEKFQFDLWKEAFEENDMSMEFYAHRRRSYDELFPWDHIDAGVSKKFLIDENEKAKNEQLTPDCRGGCRGCGINTDIARGLC